MPCCCTSEETLRRWQLTLESEKQTNKQTNNQLRFTRIKRTNFQVSRNAEISRQFTAVEWS